MARNISEIVMCFMEAVVTVLRTVFKNPLPKLETLDARIIPWIPVASASEEE